jgi:hypothetical protein
MSNIIKGTDEIPTKLEIVGVKYEDKFKKQTLMLEMWSKYLLDMVSLLHKLLGQT